MSYVDALATYMRVYGCTEEEAEKMLDSDLSVTGMTPEDLAYDLECQDNSGNYSIF